MDGCGRVEQSGETLARGPRVAWLLGSMCVASLGLLRPVVAAAPDVGVRLLAPERVAPGATVPVVVEMTLGPGWHVNSHTPSQSYLVPTVATLTSSCGTLSAVRYPKPVSRRFEFADEPLAVYEKKVCFESELTVPDTASGKVALTGAVFYQACDEHRCFPPAKAPLDAAVVIVRAPAKTK